MTKKYKGFEAALPGGHLKKTQHTLLSWNGNTPDSGLQGSTRIPHASLLVD